MPRSRPMLAALAALLLSLPACRSMRAADPATAGAVSDVVVLQVTNDNFNDVDVFALRSGVRTRIGQVGSGRTMRFSLGPTLVGPGDVDIAIVPSNGGGGITSGPLVVTGGQTIDFHVSAVLNQSQAVVR